MKAAVALLAATLVVSLGCEPCSGVAHCAAIRAVHVEGRLIETESAASVAKARVTVVLANGAVSTTATDGEGLFAATIAVDSVGSYTYDLSVVPPSDSPFVARALTCRVSGSAGDGCPLGVVVSRPYFADFVQVTYRESNIIVPNAAARFHRTGGGRIYGPSVVHDSVKTNGTDAFGNLLLFGVAVYATEVVPVVGDLTVKLPPPLDSSIIKGFVIRPRIAFREAIPPYRLEVGPTLRCSFRFYHGTPENPARDVSVTFIPRSGIPIDSTGLSGLSDSTGAAVLRPRPYARGQVIGDLLVKPPAPAPTFTVTGVILTSHDDDQAPLVLSRNLDTAPGAAGKGSR